MLNIIVFWARIKNMSSFEALDALLHCTNTVYTTTPLFHSECLVVTKLSILEAKEREQLKFKNYWNFRFQKLFGCSELRTIPTLNSSKLDWCEYLTIFYRSWSFSKICPFHSLLIVVKTKRSTHQTMLVAVNCLNCDYCTDFLDVKK